MSRKVCLLLPKELKALRAFNRKPNCNRHGHIAREDADEFMGSRDLKYVGLGRMYAIIVPNGKQGWRIVAQKIMGATIGFTTMQLRE